MKLLVEEGGADVHLKDKFGRTPADLAKEFAHVHVIDYLNERMKKSTTTTTGFVFVHTISVQKRKCSPFLDLTTTLPKMPRDITNIHKN